MRPGLTRYISSSEPSLCIVQAGITFQNKNGCQRMTKLTGASQKGTGLSQESFLLTVVGETRVPYVHIGIVLSTYQKPTDI